MRAIPEAEARLIVLPPVPLNSAISLSTEDEGRIRHRYLGACSEVRDLLCRDLTVVPSGIATGTSSSPTGVPLWMGSPRMLACSFLDKNRVAVAGQHDATVARP